MVRDSNVKQRGQPGVAPQMERNMKTKDQNKDDNSEQEIDSETGENMKPMNDDEADHKDAFDEFLKDPDGFSDTPDDDGAGDESGDQDGDDENTGGDDDESGDQDVDDTDDDQDDGDDENEDEAPNGDTETELTEAEKQQERSWQGRQRKRDQELTDREAAVADREAALSEKKDEPSGDASKDADDVPDEASLDAMLDDYPEIQKWSLGQRQAVAQMIDQKVKDAVAEGVKPVADKQADIDHLSSITQQYPDWREDRDSGAISAYIKEQPSSVQVYMDAVFKRGTTEQALDLLKDFEEHKVANNADAVQKDENRKNRKKSHVKNGQAVRTGAGNRQPKQITGDDPDDFDGAFDQASKHLASEREKVPK